MSDKVHGSVCDPPDPHSPDSRKAALVSALDAAVTVIYECRNELRDTKLNWTTGEKQTLSVTLEGLGRVCFSVARECERPGAAVTAGKGGQQ